MKDSLLEQYQKEIEKLKQEQEVQNLRRIIFNAKARHELIQSLTHWYGEYVPRVYGPSCLRTISLDKIRKSVKMNTEVS